MHNKYLSSTRDVFSFFEEVSAENGVDDGAPVNSADQDFWCLPKLEIQSFVC